MKRKIGVGIQESGVRRIIFWRLFRLLFSVFCLLLSSACGSEGGGSSNTVTTQPVLMAALPDSAPPGTTITLQGVGFSFAPNENIVIVGNTTTVGLSYQLVPPQANGATEQITFTVPNAAQVGAGNVSVLVGETPSNAVPFTVESP